MPLRTQLPPLMPENKEKYMFFVKMFRRIEQNLGKKAQCILWNAMFSLTCNRRTIEVKSIPCKRKDMLHKTA